MSKPWKTCPLCGGKMEYLYIQDGAGGYGWMCIDFEWHRVKTEVLKESNTNPWTMRLFRDKR